MNLGAASQANSYLAHSLQRARFTLETKWFGFQKPAFTHTFSTTDKIYYPLNCERL